MNDYVKARKEPPKFNWESWLVLGTILGGMAAARTAGGNDASWIDDRLALNRSVRRSPVRPAARC